MPQHHAPAATAVAPRNPYMALPDCSDEELARLYDNNASARNQGDLALLQALSREAFADAGAWARHAWGPGPLEWLDLFRPPAAAAAGAPVPALVFVHGGRWCRNTSRDTGFWAQACTAMGYAFVGLNFPKLGPAGLQDIVSAVDRGVAAVFARAGHWGLDAQRIVLAGHSSGAHLALAAALGLARPVGTVAPWLSALRAIYLLGGLYDLRPLARCTPPETLGFGAQDALCLSPLLALPVTPAPAAAMPPLLVATGTQESPEFQRQARALHWAWARQGRAQLQWIEAAAHFDAALEFNRPASRARGFVLENTGPDGGAP